jgi:hypothetical protein
VFGPDLHGECLKLNASGKFGSTFCAASIKESAGDGYAQIESVRKKTTC